MMSAASLTNRQVPADFLTPSYRIVGSVIVSRFGMMGIMNDPSTNFLEVQDAKLARLHQPSRLVDQFDIVRLVKSHVIAVCLPRSEDIGTETLTSQGKYTAMVTYPVRMTTEIYELEGTLEWAGRLDFTAMMVDGTREFMPMFDATLTGILIPNLRIESPVILFNRSHVDMLALTNQRKK